jgi:hypothetical protein
MRPTRPPDRTAAFLGSTAIILTEGFFSFSASPTPVIVPPVPTPATTASTCPSVSSQISRAVVALWAAGFAGFSNCCSITAPGISPAIRRARSTASSINVPGVLTTSAPNPRSSATRSRLIDSGIVRINR